MKHHSDFQPDQGAASGLLLSAALKSLNEKLSNFCLACFWKRALQALNQLRYLYDVDLAPHFVE